VKPTRQVVAPAVVAGLALFVLLAIRPLSTSRALAIWLLLTTALVLLVLNRRVRSGDAPSRTRRFETALRGPASASSPPLELLRVERELELGIASADYAERRLLPLLRSIATARIGSRRGIELERRPDAARDLLGDDVWELLRPDRPESADRHAPGVPREQVISVIDRLESL